MIGSLSVLALITARGGSKGLPGKNIRPVRGRPLLAYTVDAARGATAVDRVVLSSDDEAIMKVARDCGCEVPFKRPAHLATDEAGSIDVVLHALDELPGHDLVILLQPTSPMRTPADIDAACKQLLESGAQACVSVALAEQSPYWMYRVSDSQHLQPLLELPAGATRRQDLPPVYTLNGAIYVARNEWLRRSRTFVTTQTVAYRMPVERSIDIDTMDDLDRFTRLISGDH